MFHEYIQLQGYGKLKTHAACKAAGWKIIMQACPNSKHARLPHMPSVLTWILRVCTVTAACLS